MSDDADPAFSMQSWRRFLTEIELLRGHAQYYALFSLPIGAVRRHPFIDEVGPKLLYIKMAALLDEALDAFHDASGLPFLGGKLDLNGRIKSLSQHGKLSNADELHRVRRKRNDLAHESDALIEWSAFDVDVGVVDTELRHLGLVAEREELRTFWERSPDFDPKEPGVAIVFHCIVGVRSDEKIRARIEWTEKRYRFGWDEDKVRAALARGETPPSGKD